MSMHPSAGQAKCGTCGEVIRPDPMTGTICACAKPEQEACDGVVEWSVKVSAERMEEAILSLQTPDGDTCDGTLWVGRLESGSYGVHLSCDECPEEGSITLAELTAPRPAVATPDEVTDLRRALTALLVDHDNIHGPGACDCRPEPENAGHTCSACLARIALAWPSAGAVVPEGEVILEHNGCGHGAQANQLWVSLYPGDKVLIVRGRLGKAMLASAPEVPRG